MKDYWWCIILICVLPLCPPNPYTSRPFLRAEDRGRKYCLCLNETKIGSRVELQRNRQIIPTPSVCVCEEGRAKTFPFGGPQRHKQIFKRYPTQDTHADIHSGTNMLLVPHRLAEKQQLFSCVNERKVVSHPTDCSLSVQLLLKSPPITQEQDFS